MQAFMAPMSWAALTREGENIIDANEYATLLWAAKPVLKDIPTSRLSLPTKVKGQHVKQMYVCFRVVILSTASLQLVFTL